jgi:hypothetical protein
VEWKHTQNLKSNSYFLTKGAHLDIDARFFTNFLQNQSFDW